MSKKNVLALIESVLAKTAKGQINLGSESARKELARDILDLISKKYYLISYSSQESFE